MPLFPAVLFLESLTFDLAGGGVMKDLQRSFVAAEITRLPRRSLALIEAVTVILSLWSLMRAASLQHKADPRSDLTVCNRSLQ